MREQPLLLLLLYCIQSSLAASWHGKGRDWPGFGSWHQAPGTASANHIINDYTQHAALQLSRKPLRALPVRRTVRRTLPEGSRVTGQTDSRQLHLVLARLLLLRVLFIFIFNFASFFYLFIYLYFLFAAAACFSALFFLVMAPFLHDFVIYMHTHARADTYTLTHARRHTHTCTHAHVASCFCVPFTCHACLTCTFYAPYPPRFALAISLSLPLFLSVLSCCLAINLANEKTPGKRDKFSDLVTKRRQKKNNTKKIQIALNVKSIWMPKTFHPPLSHSTLPSAALSHTVSVASL